MDRHDDRRGGEGQTGAAGQVAKKGIQLEILVLQFESPSALDLPLFPDSDGERVQGVCAECVLNREKQIGQTGEDEETAHVN